MSRNNLQWNQNQFDAMVSVAFNSGSEGFYNIANRIVIGWEPQNAFTWHYTAEKARSGKEDGYLGLWRRRMDECDIFLNGTYLREDRIP